MTINKNLTKEQTKDKQGFFLKDFYNKYHDLIVLKEAYSYIDAYVFRSIKISIALSLFIVSNLFSVYSFSFYNIDSELLYYLSIFIAIMLIIVANKKFKANYKDVPCLSPSSYNVLINQFPSVKKTAERIKIAGIITFICASFPFLILKDLGYYNLGETLFIIILAIASFLLINAKSRLKAYKKLLR